MLHLCFALNTTFFCEKLCKLFNQFISEFTPSLIGLIFSTQITHPKTVKRQHRFMWLIWILQKVTSAASIPEYQPFSSRIFAFSAAKILWKSNHYSLWCSLHPPATSICSPLSERSWHVSLSLYFFFHHTEFVSFEISRIRSLGSLNLYGINEMYFFLLQFVCSHRIHVMFWETIHILRLGIAMQKSPDTTCLC